MASDFIHSVSVTTTLQQLNSIGMIEAAPEPVT